LNIDLEGGKVQVRVTENSEQFGKCGCGRSPTGYCIGWHGLTVEQYHVKLADYKYKLQEVTIEEEEAFKLLEKKKI